MKILFFATKLSFFYGDLSFNFLIHCTHPVQLQPNLRGLVVHEQAHCWVPR